MNSGRPAKKRKTQKDDIANEPNDLNKQRKAKQPIVVTAVSTFVMLIAATFVKFRSLLKKAQEPQEPNRFNTTIRNRGIVEGVTRKSALSRTFAFAGLALVALSSSAAIYTLVFNDANAVLALLALAIIAPFITILLGFVIAPGLGIAKLYGVFSGLSITIGAIAKASTIAHRTPQALNGDKVNRFLMGVEPSFVWASFVWFVAAFSIVMIAVTLLDSRQNKVIDDAENLQAQLKHDAYLKRPTVALNSPRRSIGQAITSVDRRAARVAKVFEELTRPQ